MAAAPELLRVPLFQSAHAGFGDSREVAPNRYNRILYGFDARFPGELRFGDFFQKLPTLRSKSALPTGSGDPVHAKRELGRKILN